MTYQYTGTIDKIFPTAQVTDTFRKRVVWLRNESNNEKYPPLEHVEFEATQDNVNKLDLFKVGEVVVVTFVVRGRKYTSKTTGNEGVYTSLALIGIQSVHSQQTTHRDYTESFNGTPF